MMVVHSIIVFCGLIAAAVGSPAREGSPLPDQSEHGLQDTAMLEAVMHGMSCHQINSDEQDPINNKDPGSTGSDTRKKRSSGSYSYHVDPVIHDLLEKLTKELQKNQGNGQYIILTPCTGVTSQGGSTNPTNCGYVQVSEDQNYDADRANGASTNNHGSQNVATPVTAPTSSRDGTGKYPDTSHFSTEKPSSSDVSTTPTEITTAPENDPENYRDSTKESPHEAKGPIENDPSVKSESDVKFPITPVTVNVAVNISTSPLPTINPTGQTVKTGENTNPTETKRGNAGETGADEILTPTAAEVSALTNDPVKSVGDVHNSNPDLVSSNPTSRDKSTDDPSKITAIPANEESTPTATSVTISPRTSADSAPMTENSEIIVLPLDNAYRSSTQGYPHVRSSIDSTNDINIAKSDQSLLNLIKLTGGQWPVIHNYITIETV